MKRQHRKRLYLLMCVIAVSLSLVGCGDDDPDANDANDTADAAAETTDDVDATTSDDLLSGVYNVETVTCGGQVEPIMVTATVTFDDNSYLEEWTLPGSACEVTFAGTLDATDDQVTIQDVAVTCGAACADLGFCDATHCSSDQTYQYTRNGDELLLSFTQQGDEFSCGPCGDGVASTYLLKVLP